ncbi:MAG: hypothetical protein ACOYNY_41210 [Caldilineaceae bacterium]
MHKMIRIICYFLCALSVVACPRVPTPGAVDAVATTASVPQAANTISAQPTETPAAATETPANQAVDTPAPTATPQALPTDTPVPTPEPLFYNLPPATLTNATGLYASPNRAELIVPVPVPAGETVFIMGRNATGTHLRVVWNTGVGWVPVSFTSYNGERDRMAALPVFERELPSCAVPLTTQFGLNSTWTSDLQQRIAVIAALFRSRYGEFPASSLALVVNGVTVESSRRAIVEQGQFSLKDVVFSVPQDLQPGDTVGYQLDTASDEPLTFMATIFSVPSNCKWKLD